ncbi:MAG: tetratricopeptide repeat protein, partial [Bacteroidales bacterium]
MTFQNRVSCILCLFLVMAAFQAFSVPGVQDTIVERLFGEGQYRMVSVRIAGELKKQNSSSGSDLRLYYYNRLSMACFRLNNFDSSMICARQALQLSSGSKDSTLISDAWKVMSYSFNRLGKLDSAIYFTNKLMNYSKRAGNDHQYRNSLVSLGTILMQNQRPSEALKNFREANRINKKMNDTASFVYDYFNIGLVHLKLKQ